MFMFSQSKRTQLATWVSFHKLSYLIIQKRTKRAFVQVNFRSRVGGEDQELFVN